jgi:hypothetical protein
MSFAFDFPDIDASRPQGIPPRAEVTKGAAV